MLSKAENDLLTRVEGDAPMGRMMRENYWLPFALSSQLIPGEAPHMATLLGRHYVALRAPDGRVGFFDEGCPHRGASLALARVEEGHLRCIFHAWKFDITGQAVECPTETGDRHAAFCARVRLTAYPVHEAGGLVWVWLGSGAEAPPFPELPFAGALEENSFLTVSLGQCNWLQGVEATLDSAHIGTLHKTWIAGIKTQKGGNVGMSLDGPPRYEAEITDYGLRAVALRPLVGGRTYARITEYLMPFVTLAPSNGTKTREGVIFITTPVDDARHLMFFGLYSDAVKQDPVAAAIQPPGASPDLLNYAPLPGGREARWGQDRALMAAGHFTGFGNNILEEDMVVQASMGAIVDRTREILSMSDVAIVKARRMMLASLADYEGGKLPTGSALVDGPVVLPNPIDTVIEPDRGWQDAAALIPA